MINKQHSVNNQFAPAFRYALVSSVLLVATLLTTFMAFEPMAGRAATFVEDSQEFYIRQTITGETSFLVQPSNVSMAGSIAGVTGGQATGTTDFSVISNNSAGYYVQISFENNGTPEAMIGDNTSSQSIRDYDGDTITGQPSWGYVASTAAQFAYTVTSDTPSDTSDSFLNDGGDCNAGVTQTPNMCWKAPDTAPFRIVDRDTAANTGATSTLTFNVTVPSGSDPQVVADTYTATATLSLYIK